MAAKPGTLHGMAWDHPRAVNPLHAISARWSAETGCRIRWDARPLKDFEDQPLEELATRYDLILIDYPFVGFAAESGMIVPVNDWVDAAYLSDQAANSVGPSFASYGWFGKQWALAIDAACQVSAARNDLLDRSNVRRPPATWDEVADFAAACRTESGKVAMPLNPNHAYCAFLAVGLSRVGPRFWPEGRHPVAEAAAQSLEFLRRVAADLHPLSGEADPIAISDRMTATDEIFYVPLMFGYSNYSRPELGNRSLRFGNVPVGNDGHLGSVLGGVGIALSALSEHRDVAADLARRVASPEMQSGLYASAGGQPGHASAWESSAVNEPVQDFFVATRETIDRAFLRPRVTGHRRFQVLAGELVHRFIWGSGTSAAACAREFDGLVDAYLSDWVDSAASKS